MTAVFFIAISVIFGFIGGFIAIAIGAPPGVGFLIFLSSIGFGFIKGIREQRRHDTHRDWL